LSIFLGQRKKLHVSVNYLFPVRDYQVVYNNIIGRGEKKLKTNIDISIEI